MVILISGASHTGKTVLAQRILDRVGFPYLCLDHLKMGLIRCGYSALTPSEDDELTAYLWPIAREMVKTAIENRQNLVVEGCYIPFDWAKDFGEEYLPHIRHCCLAMTAEYICGHFDQICRHACAVESREDESALSTDWLIGQNVRNRRLCNEHACHCVLIDDDYESAIQSALEELVAGI